MTEQEPPTVLARMLAAGISEDRVRSHLEAGRVRVEFLRARLDENGEIAQTKRAVIDQYEKSVSGELEPRPRWAADLNVAVRLLALPFAGHPDYRAEEWAL